MSYFDPSMEPMLEMFIFETTTLLEQLDEILLDSEKNQTITQDNINEIFRIMHTIKGSSAMMGLEETSVVAHRIEDMFFLVREDQGIMVKNSSAIFDLLFKASDFLKSEVELIHQPEQYSPSDSSALVGQIQQQIAVIKGEADASSVATPAAMPAPVENNPKAEPAAPKKETAGQSNANTLHQLRVFFEDDCQMENIRAFMLLSQIKELCEYLDSVPASPETNSGYADEIIKNGFLIRFKTAYPPQEIYSVIEHAINIKSYEVVDNETNAASIKETVQQQQQEQQQQDAGEDHAQSTAQGNKTAAIGKQNLISVNQNKLDKLMDIMGEIIIAESMVASNPELKGLKLDNFHKATRQLRKLTDQMQDVVMSIRMVPLSGVFQKMNRIVRDMGKKLGKEVELVTYGGDTEIDKTISDVLADPFMHMIRNAMDHALESPQERLALGKPEQGIITLSAQNVGGEIVITVADDGRGLDRDKLLAKAKRNNLLTKPESEYTDKEVFGMIMLPGFSTNEQVTEFSGRGVGMDVVRKNIEKVSGSLSVESQKNIGTTFTVKIPLTLAIIDGMEISIVKERFTVPINAIRQTFKLSSETQVIHDTTGSEMIMLRGECYPIIRLHRLYDIKEAKSELADGIFLLVESGGKAVCLFADELVGEQQVVVKPFPTFLGRYDIKHAGLAGCTIMGDGSISLILDINSFINKY